MRAFFESLKDITVGLCNGFVKFYTQLCLLCLAALIVICTCNFLKKLQLRINFRKKPLFKFLYKDNSCNMVFRTEKIFLPYSKLPTDFDLFSRDNKTNLSGTKLPPIDMNAYDFKNVKISWCKFHKKSKLPKDINFFQNIYAKDLSGCHLPAGDYSNFNFKGVDISNLVFTKDSVLPKDPRFFRDSKNPSYIHMTLPKSFAEDCELYDYTNVSLYSAKDLLVNDAQKYLLVKRYGYNVAGFISWYSG